MVRHYLRPAPNSLDIQGKLPAILLPEIQFDGLPRVDSSVQSRDPVQVHELRR